MSAALGWHKRQEPSLPTLVPTVRLACRQLASPDGALVSFSMQLFLCPAFGARGPLWPTPRVSYTPHDAANLEMFLHHLLRGLALALNVPCASVCICWDRPPPTWEADHDQEVLGRYVISPLPDSVDPEACGECLVCGDPCTCARHSEVHPAGVDPQSLNCSTCFPCCLCSRCRATSRHGPPICFLCIREDSEELAYFLRTSTASTRRRYRIIEDHAGPQTVRLVERTLVTLRAP